MIKLELFLAQNKIGIDDYDLKAKIHKWLRMIKPTFAIYQRFILEPLETNPKYQMLNSNYQEWFREDKFLNLLQVEIEHYFSSESSMIYSRNELIANIQNLVDLHLRRLMQHVIWITTERPLKPSINPFDKKVSGVEMRAYLKTDEFSDVQEIGQIAVSEVGHICSHQRLSPAGLFIPFHKNVKRAAYTHAEYKWFQQSLDELINKLKQVNKSKYLKKDKDVLLEHDSQILDHLDIYPRLEFVLSSSNCHDCRPLFVELRQLLDNLGFNIPILIYSSKPFNTNQISQSSLSLVNYQGQFIDTNLRIDMDYDNNCSRVGNQHQILLDKVKAIEADLECEEILVRQYFMNDAFKKQLIASLIHRVCENQSPNQHDLYWLESWVEMLPNSFYANFVMEKLTIKDYIHEKLKTKDVKKKEKKPHYSSEVLKLVKNQENIRFYCQPCQSENAHVSDGLQYTL